MDGPSGQGSSRIGLVPPGKQERKDNDIPWMDVVPGDDVCHTKSLPGACFPEPCRTCYSPAMDTVRARLENLEEEFALLDSWSLRFQYLMELKDAQVPLAPEACTPETLVPGCTSPLWLQVEVRQGLRHVSARCDSGIPAGLAALCVQLLDATAPDPAGEPGVLEIINRLGLETSLSPTRLATLGRMLARGLSA